MAGIDAVLGIIESIAGEVNQSQEKSRTLKELANIQQSNLVAQGVYGGEKIMADRATEGLAGYEGMREEVQSELPATYEGIKGSVMDGTFIDWIGKYWAKQNQALRELSYKNAQEKDVHKKEYATYLGSTVGGAQRDVNTTNMQLALAKMATEQQANKGSMSYLNQLFGDFGNLLKSTGDSSQTNNKDQITSGGSTENTGGADWMTGLFNQ